MACKRKAVTNPSQDSYLFDKLFEIAKQDENKADDYKAWFESDVFVEQFGDWKTDFKEEPVNRKIDQRRVDDNGEPRLSWDKIKGVHYFIDKYGTKVTFNPEGKYINDVLTNEDVREITKFLAFDFLKQRIDDNFNTLDLSAGNTTLRSSINDKLKSKIEELYGTTASDPMQYMVVTALEDTLSIQDQWVEAVVDFFSELKLKYKETTQTEDILEEEDSERGQAYDKASFEKSTKDNISANVKLRLSLLVDLDNMHPIWNEPTFLDFDEVYGTLLTNITDQVSLDSEDLFELYKEKIIALANKKPYFEDLHRILSRKGLSENIKAEFVQAFNLHKNNFIGTTYFMEMVENEAGENVYETKAVVRNLSDVGSKTQHVKSNWQYNFMKMFMPEGKLTEKSRETLSEQLVEYKDNYFVKWKQALREGIETEDQFAVHAEAMQLELSKLGVDITGEEFAHFLDGLDSANLSLEKRRENLDTLAGSINFFYKAAKDGSLVSQERSPFDNQSTFKQLAAAKAFFLSQGTDASIYTTGKTKWLFSYPSYLSTKIKKWRKDPSLLEALYQNTTINRGSRWMKYLLAKEVDHMNEEEVRQKRLDAFDLNVFNSLQESGGRATDNKGISKNDSFVDVLNKSLGFMRKAKNSLSYLVTPTPADKSTLYQLTLPEDMMMRTNAVFQNKKVVVNDAATETVFGYLDATFERIKQVQREIDDALSTGNTKELVLDYHFKIEKDEEGNSIRNYKAGNGLKFQLFPTLNAGSEKLGLFDKNGRPNLKVNLGIDAIKPNVKEIINERFSEDILDLTRQLAQKKLFLLNNKGTYTNRAFDSEIFEAYEKQSKNPGIALAADVYINSLIAQVEYSNMFSGDIAYYKDEVDYKKRIPATYTDGLQLYQRIGDPQKYMASVIEGVIIPEPYLKELRELISDDVADKYLGVNSTDAQAWITPQRWKYLRERLGKFSDLDQSIYNKMLTDKPEYTEEELKRAAQPLKGVYFDINEGRPVYLKYSQAVLIPNLVKGSQLQGLLDQMNKQKIDEVITVDGVKVGAFDPVQTHDAEGNILEDFTLTPMPLNNSGWKLQQDLPTKTTKMTDVGSQIQKIIFSGLSFNQDKMFLVGDQEMSGNDLIDHINRITKNLSDKGFESLKKEFGIGDDNKIHNLARLNNAIISELKSRGASTNVIRALESGISPFALPGYQEKIQNVFASMVLKKVVKIQTNGGAFIQMSNYGLNKGEAEAAGVIWSPNSKGKTHNYEYIRDEEGNILTTESGVKRIRPAGILLSGSFIAKYIPNYKEMSKEELFSRISPEILENLIGYRIPNQGLASNDALEVVGILPETSGDTVVAYTGITTKTGSDFDIDKMYIMMPTFIPQRSAAKQLRRTLNASLRGKTIQDTIDNISAVLEQLDPDENIKVDVNKFSRRLFARDKSAVMALQQDLLVEAILKSEAPLAKHIKESVPNFGKVTSLKYIKPPAEITEDTSIAELQNMLIDSYKAVLTHEDVIESVMTPIDFTFFRDDILSMTEVPPAKDLGVVNILDEINLRFEFMAGKAGVGQTANALVDHVRGQMGDLSLLGVSFDRGNYNEVGESKFDLEYSEELSAEDMRYYAKELGIPLKEVKKLQKIKIADSLSALMNAYVDIAKDPYITRGNWTTQTANVGFMLIRAGIHPFYVNALLAQPIIKEYAEFVSNAESIIGLGGGDLIRKFVNEKIKEGLQKENAKITINGKTISKARVFATIGGVGRTSYSVQKYFNVDKNDKVNMPLVTELYEEFKAIEAEYLANNDYKVLEQPLEQLRNNLKTNLNVQDQLSILNTFKELVDNSKKVVNNINASKSDVTGYGKNIASLLVNFNLVNDHLEGVKIPGAFKGFESKLYRNGQSTVLGTYVTNSIDRIKDIMQANPLQFLAANRIVFDTFNEISKGIYGENLTNQTLADKIHRQFTTFVMSGFPALQMDIAEKEELLRYMVPALLKYQKQFPNNKFLQELDIKIGDGALDFVGMSNRKKSPALESDLIAGWRDLMDDPETENFANKLVKYSFLTSGFQMNINQFFTYIPYQWFTQNKINEYIHEVANKYNTQVLMDQSFIQDFFRHNMKDSSIVPFVFRDDMAQFRKFPQNGFVLKMKSVANGSPKRYVKVDFSFFDELSGGIIERIGLFEHEGFNKDGNPVYIRKIPLGYQDSRGNKVIESDKSLPAVPTLFKDNKVNGLTEEKRNNVRKQIVSEPLAFTDAVPAEENNIKSAKDVVDANNAQLENERVLVEDITKLPVGTRITNKAGEQFIFKGIREKEGIGNGGIRIQKIGSEDILVAGPNTPFYTQPNMRSGLVAPKVEITLKSNLELANTPGGTEAAVEAISKQERLKRERAKLDELIKCIWRG